jgi:hypothetical protein
MFDGVSNAGGHNASALAKRAWCVLRSTSYCQFADSGLSSSVVAVVGLDAQRSTSTIGPLKVHFRSPKSIGTTISSGGRLD